MMNFIRNIWKNRLTMSSMSSMDNKQHSFTAVVSSLIVAVICIVMTGTAFLSDSSYAMAAGSTGSIVMAAETSDSKDGSSSKTYVIDDAGIL